MAKPFVAPERKEGGFFVAKDEKEELITQGTELVVNKVELRDSPFEKDQQQYIVVVDLDDEERGLSFTTGTVFSRDELLAALKTYLETEEDQEPVTIKLTKQGRAIIVEVV